MDKEAGTRAFMPEGNLYNEPEIPSSYEAESAFQTVGSDLSVDAFVRLPFLLREKGLGVTIVPRTVAKKFIERGEVCELRPWA